MRILVIDDEPLIIRSLTRLLRQHDVVGAQGRQEALTILREDSAFDGVFCDVRMPDTNGLDLVQEVVTRWPHLAARICICSGSASHVGHLPRLEKPFSRDALQDQISAWAVGDPGER